MEPKVSMTWFMVADLVGVVLLGLGGHPVAGGWVAAGLVVVAAFLHTIYLVQRKAAKHMPETFRSRRPEGLIPDHRRRLDRWVLSQWLAIAVIGIGGSELLLHAGWEPFHRVGLVFNVLVIGWIVLWSGIYLSALVDWFLVLPKVSGVSCPAPCERPGKQRWAGITALWCFHRGFARLLVPAVLIGCPTVIGAVTASSGGRAIAFSIGAVFALYLAEFELQGKAALSYGLNPRRYVGDTVWLIRETADSVYRQPAYLLDVSAEGGKFKYVDDGGHYLGDEFDEKDDEDGEPLTLSALNTRARVDDAVAPCGERCTGVNWYCWRNPLAYSQTASAGDE
jgi:hypothetical protein